MFNYNDDYLTPGNIIVCTENQFRDEFIYKLDSQSGYGKRGQRWNEYCDFISFVKKQKLRKPFKVWIYGSLVGKYKEPNDVDIILFFDKSDFQNITSSNVGSFIISNAKVIFNIDCPHIFEIAESEEELSKLEQFRLDLPCRSNDGQNTKGAIEIVY